jgi:hypothetical protein
MEFILMSIASSATLLVAQFVELVRREYAAELGPRMGSIPPRLLGTVETLTVTVPVAATYRG